MSSNPRVAFLPLSLLPNPLTPGLRPGDVFVCSDTPSVFVLQSFPLTNTPYWGEQPATLGRFVQFEETALPARTYRLKWTVVRTMGLNPDTLALIEVAWRSAPGLLVPTLTVGTLWGASVTPTNGLIMASVNTSGVAELSLVAPGNGTAPFGWRTMGWPEGYGTATFAP